MTAEFYTDKFGRENVRLKNGKKHMDTLVAIKSKNGRFSAVADFWYENVPYIDDDGEQDESEEEIEGSETLYVLDGNSVAYSIKGIVDIDTDNAVLRDDGTICLFDNEENLIAHALTGGKISRKPSFSALDANLNEDIAWWWGDDDNGKSKFTVFLIATMTSWTRQLPKDASNIQDIWLHEDNTIWVQYGMYDDTTRIALYTLDGKKIATAENTVPKNQATEQPETKKSEPVPVEQFAPPVKRKSKSRKWIIWGIAILVVIVFAFTRCTQ